MRIVRLWMLVCVAGLVVGCGQKGPLVLPDTPPKHKKAAPSPRAPTAPAPSAPAVPAPAGAPATEAPSNPPDTAPKP